MKILSWNVNGLRAVQKKGFGDWLRKARPDILCVQESRALPEQVEADWPKSYAPHWNPAEKKGYSGVITFTKPEPVDITPGMGIAEHDREGRVLATEHDDFILVNVYVPNAQRSLARLPYRKQWDCDFLAYLKKLERRKPVVVCGDFNVSHQEIDLARPKDNRKNAGFTDEERAGFEAFVAAGFIDTFREFESSGGHYTWWSNRLNARARNIGWRIDYFLISASLRLRLKKAFILPNVMGSDQCPVGIEIS